MSTLRTRAFRKRRDAGIVYRLHVDVSWEDIAYMVRCGHLAPDDIHDRKKIEPIAQMLWERVLSGEGETHHYHHVAS
jgi:hypothetical protein